MLVLGPILGHRYDDPHVMLAPEVFEDRFL